MATDYPIEITDPDGSVRIAGLADFTDPDNQPAGPQTEFDVVDGDGNVRGRLFFDSDDNQLVLEQLDTDGETVIAFAKIGGTSLYGAPADGGEVGFDLAGSGGPGGHARLLNGFTGGLGSAFVLDSGQIGDFGSLALIYGNTDPTAGDGLDFGAGTLYAVFSTGTAAALWFQTASGPPTWVNLTP